VAIRPKAADISERAVLAAIRDFHAHKGLPPPDESLGLPLKVVEAKFRKLERRGLIECGVSLRTAWLTDAGKARLAELGEE